MRDSKSKTLNFGTIMHYVGSGDILSLMFTEYYFYDPDDDSAVGQAEKDSWTLASF